MKLLFHTLHYLVYRKTIFCTVQVFDSPIIRRYLKTSVLGGNEGESFRRAGFERSRDR